MEINEYLKLFRKQLFYPRLKEETQLSEFFISVTGSNGISFSEIYSTTIYPEFVQIEGERFMLWDNHFWDLYERFLLGFILAKSPKVDYSVIFEYINAISFLFLTNRFDSVPCLSYIFARHYAGTGFAVPPYNKFEATPNRDKLITAGYHKTLISGKLYVFFHEVIHSLIKIDSSIFDDDREDIIRFCAELIDNNIDGQVRETALEIIQGKDEGLIEEICCDLRAITESIRLLHKSSAEGADKKQTLMDFIMDIRYLLTFHGSMLQIEGAWQANRRGIDEFGAEFILHAEDQITQQNVVINKANSRVNLVLYLAFRLHGYTDFNSDDFIDAEWFSKFIVPSLEFVRSSDLMKKIFEDYLNLKPRYSAVEFRTSKNMLVITAATLNGAGRGG